MVSACPGAQCQGDWCLWFVIKSLQLNNKSVMLTLLILMKIITSSAAVLTVHWNVSLTSHTLTNICGNYTAEIQLGLTTHTTSESDLKTIINCCYAKAMFWVKIKTVFNLNFIPQAINPDVYCWFFKIFYVNTKPGHALFICSELLEFSLVSNQPELCIFYLCQLHT